VSATSEMLEERVTSLERQNRWLRAVVVAVVILLAALLALQARPTRIAAVAEAEKFVVRDRKGRARAVLGLDHATGPEHSPVRLALYNEEHRSSAVLYLSDAFAGLTIKTGAEGGKRSINLFANPKDGAGLGLDAGLRSNAIRMTADAAAAVRLVMKDSAGNVVFRAP